MLESIEKRLGAKIESMAPISAPASAFKYTFELPAWAAGLSFGEDKAAPETTSEHVTAIERSVAVRARYRAVVSVTLQWFFFGLEVC